MQGWGELSKWQRSEMSELEETSGYQSNRRGNGGPAGPQIREEDGVQGSAGGHIGMVESARSALALGTTQLCMCWGSGGSEVISLSREMSAHRDVKLALEACVTSSNQPSEHVGSK